MAFVIQRQLRALTYGRVAAIRTASPAFICEQFRLHLDLELSRANELNPDPAGIGVLTSLDALKDAISVGATILICTSIVGMRSSALSSYNLPGSTERIESWIRANSPKATLPMDNAEYLAYYFADYFKGVCFDLNISSVEVLSCLADDRCDTTRHTEEYFAALLDHGLLAGHRSVSSAVAAYSRYVQFKSATMKLATTAMPTGGLGSGWSLIRAEPFGPGLRLFASVDSSLLSDVEMCKAAYFRRLSDAEDFVHLSGNRNDLNFNGFTSNCVPEDAIFLQAITARVMSECTLLYLIRGPSMTFYPHPVMQLPVAGQGIGPAPAGGGAVGLFPLPVNATGVGGPAVPPVTPIGSAALQPAQIPQGIDQNAALI